MPKLCQFENCRNRASYGYRYECPERCKEHREDRKPQYKVCQCGKAQPSYNEPEETKPICCGVCKTGTMVDVKNEKCQCGKARPYFNETGETRPICCRGCKTGTMVDVKNPRCKCGKAQPSYNEPGQTKPICCGACKTGTMVDVVSKKCQCGKAQPHFNEPGESKPICCGACKTGTMVDVINKKCQCGKARPYFNEPGESKPICCGACKTGTMVDVRSEKCQCGKARPTYNEPGKTRPICCGGCKTGTMVDVVSKKCQCGKAIPSYNEPGETRPICCGGCKTGTMVNVKNKRCKGQEGYCPQQGNKKYKGYCTHCFRHTFPLDPMTFQIRSKTKEIAVRDYINSVFEGFQHDKTMETGGCDCSVRRRIDHRRLIGNTILAVETDENQHLSYDAMDEQARYDDLYMAFPGKWVYIRFNPDKYLTSRGKNVNPSIATRLPILRKEIEKQIKRIEHGENIQLVERIYMFYDGYT